ncbi:MAG: ACT domain-containing protein [Ruminococcaceae bacterium]|nr:ACT domain-containing protein [Oscillospiraceae bacterium]
MRAIVTVVGKDRVGIIANICTSLAEYNINILDISQTVMSEFFTMSMLVDASKANEAFDVICENFSEKGKEMGMSIRVQREDIFNAMHSI